MFQWWLGIGALGALCALAVGASGPQVAAADRKPVPVRLEKSEAGFQLMRGGKPYFIKGAGGQTRLAALAAAGGNSIRTWDAGNDLGATLDEAERLGITVTVGIWLGHERHGFNYNDPQQVAQQYERARQAVLRYKDHPAVLMWGIGNEMEGEKGDNAAIWSAINNIAGMAQRLDPDHPTMTVIAEIGGDKLKNLHRLCPEIDVVGVNSYAGAPSLARRYAEAGGTKPYVMTEFGPPGMWESAKTSWGSPVEKTSTEKADAYRESYQKAVLDQPGRSLGAYAFAWGHKQEATATWFGMFLPDGGRLAAVDTMTELWSGKPPANRAPAIRSLKVEGDPQTEPGATLRAALQTTDPEGDPLKVKWVLQREPFAYGSGGDAEEVPPTFPDAIVQGDLTGAQVRLPKDGGGYRLFAYVYDSQGGAAVANVPLRVKGPEAAIEARVAKLPLVLYDEGETAQSPYTPAGWMGNTKGIRMDLNWKERPHTGKLCIRAEYADKADWAGVVWQSPVNDWGDLPGGWNLTGAKRLTFWARGENGDEVVSFEVGLLAKDKRFFDTGNAKSGPVKLTKEWKQYSLDVQGLDLKRIKTGFAWIAQGAGKPTVFYLDDIQYE